MLNNALGMIETYGILPAIEAIDTAVKSANIVVLPKILVGGGLVVVLFRCDVSSVSTAVKSGAAAASRVGEVLSSHVIARVHSNVWGTLPNGFNFSDANLYSEEEKAHEKKVVDNYFNIKVEKEKKDFGVYSSTNKNSNIDKVKGLYKKDDIENTNKSVGSEKKVDIASKNNGKKKKKSNI